MRDTSWLQAPDRFYPHLADSDRSGALADVNAYGADHAASAEAFIASRYAAQAGQAA
jgi:hypothetical protein